MRPSPRVNALIVGVLAKAAERYDVRLHAVCFLSNHCHLLMSSADATELSHFMRYANSNIAREVGRLHGWREKFWGRRYTVGVVLDSEAQIDRLGYLLVNAAKEGLVKHARHWPGVHSVNALCRGQALVGVWVDRTRQHRARLRGDDTADRAFETRLVLKLHKLPCWAHLDDHAYRHHVTETCRRHHQRHRRPDEAPTLGVRRVLRQNPHDRPSRSGRSPAPACHATAPATRRAFAHAYRRFVDSYRDTMHRAQRGLRTLGFPPEAVTPAGLRGPPRVTP